MRTHLEAQHGGTAVKHLDAEGVDVRRARRCAAPAVPVVADDVEDDAVLGLGDSGDVIAVVFRVVAPGDVWEAARLVEEQRDETRVSQSD